MKNALCRLLPAILLAALPAAVSAETSVDATTIVRVQQEAQSPSLGGKTFVPITQFLGADFDKLGDGNLSVHLLGWGQLDFTDDRRTVDDKERRTQGSLTYGYLQYRFNQANARARAGRFFVNEGIVNEQVDGVSFRTDLPYGFGVSAFGGAPVHTVDIPGAGTDGKGDGIFGGRVNYRLGGKLELGISGVYESRVPELRNNPAPTVPLGFPAGSFGELGSFGSHRQVGADVYFSPINMLQLSGHSTYNTETKKLAEHTYLLQVTPIKNLTLAGSYDYHRDRDYFYSSILFSDMLRTIGQESRVLGASATYAYRQLELSGDFKDYQRDIGKAERFGGELRGYFADNTVRSGLSYHYLRASSDFAIVPIATASGSFHEARAWAMRDTKSYFAAIDLIDYIFRKPVEGKDNAWEATGSLGYHLTPAFALSGDVSYGQNPQFDDEVKGLIRLTYNMTTGKGATK